MYSYLNIVYFQACVQHVFSSLFHDFTDNFSTALIELVETQCQPITTDDLSTILLKDAIYNAIGLSSLDLYEHVMSNSIFYERKKVLKKCDRFKINDVHLGQLRAVAKNFAHPRTQINRRELQNFTKADILANRRMDR